MVWRQFPCQLTFALAGSLPSTYKGNYRQFCSATSVLVPIEIVATAAENFIESIMSPTAKVCFPT